MLLTLVPLFDEELTVKAYSVFAQRENQFVNPFSYGTGMYDGSTNVEGFEAIASMGLDTLSDDKAVFVPVTNVSVFSDIESNCPENRDKVAILIDNTIPPVPMYIERLRALKEAGFMIAIRKLQVSDFQVYSPIFAIADFIFLNNKRIAIDKAKIYFQRLFPDISLVAGNIDTMEEFLKIKQTGGYSYYEGDFYRIPASKNEHEVAPFKVTYIQLLNTVNSPDFELNEAADIISKDTALTFSLLEMVNRVVKMSEIKTIKHATAMLGQRELKKWINTAIADKMYSDQPGELTRVSLLRAKFAESLASEFGIGNRADELFLMGLFSVMDVALNTTMEEALNMIQLSSSINAALIKNEGDLAPIWNFIVAYESADWSEVSRLMLLNHIEIDKVYNAYIESLEWYRKTIKG